jgi:aldehyde dehydrogenase (NAD+)
MAPHQKLVVRSPYNQAVIGELEAGDEESVNAALNRLTSYDFSLTPYQRYAILDRAKTLVAKEKEAFAKLIVDEIGITISDARHEVDRSIAVLELCAEESKRITGEIFPNNPSADIQSDLIYSVREPCGVVAAITPFNHPLNQVVHKVCPALAANNAVLLKPSDKCPLTALKFVELLYEAGVPEEMLQCLTGTVSSLGERFVSDPRIDMVSFTGSTAVGEKITRTAGVKKLFLELGGNDALVICEDADLDLAVELAIAGSFKNSGQRCTAVKRIIVDCQVHDEFIERLAFGVAALNCGDPYSEESDVGCVINEAYAEEIVARIDQASRAGASVICGGGRIGALLQPTVIDSVTMEMSIVQQETFGPCAPVLISTDLDHAIALVNETPYGLSSAIVTSNIRNVMKFTKLVKAGGVRVNRVPGFRNEYLPFGGVKLSGFGRSGVKKAIEEMTYIKTVII